MRPSRIECRPLRTVMSESGHLSRTCNRSHGISILFLVALAVVPVPYARCEDVDLDGKTGFKDLLLLSTSWTVFFTPDGLLDLQDDWGSTVDYDPRVASVVREVTPEGSEPQVFVDRRGTAHFVYRIRAPRKAPDGSIVETLQLAYTSILDNGSYGRTETIVTDREPNLRIFGEYFSPALDESVIVRSPDKRGDFFAIWPNYTGGLSLVRFSEYGFPKSREYVVAARFLDDVEEMNAVMDVDRNIHVVWTECPYCFADPEIRGPTREVKYTKITPAGDILVGPPLHLGERPDASGNAEIFRPEICLDGERDVLVLIDQGENNKTRVVRVDGALGTVKESKTLEENFVEPDCVVLPNGEVAMAAMIFDLGVGRNIYFTVLNADLTTKVPAVALTNTAQQSDGAGIVPIGSDFYVAYNENKDNFMRLARVGDNGAFRRGPVKLSGPGVGFPYRLRLEVDQEGAAHIVYADGKGSTPARITYEKLSLE